MMDASVHSSLHQIVLSSEFDEKVKLDAIEQLAKEFRIGTSSWSAILLFQFKDESPGWNKMKDRLSILKKTLLAKVYFCLDDKHLTFEQILCNTPEIVSVAQMQLFFEIFDRDSYQFSDRAKYYYTSCLWSGEKHNCLSAVQSKVIKSWCDFEQRVVDLKLDWLFEFPFPDAVVAGGAMLELLLTESVLGEDVDIWVRNGDITDIVRWLQARFPDAIMSIEYSVLTIVSSLTRKIQIICADLKTPSDGFDLDYVQAFWTLDKTDRAAGFSSGCVQVAWVALRAWETRTVRHSTISNSEMFFKPWRFAKAIRKNFSPVFLSEHHSRLVQDFLKNPVSNCTEITTLSRLSAESRVILQPLHPETFFGYRTNDHFVIDEISTCHWTVIPDGIFAEHRRSRIRGWIYWKSGDERRSVVVVTPKLAVSPFERKEHNSSQWYGAADFQDSAFFQWLNMFRNKFFKTEFHTKSRDPLCFNVLSKGSSFHFDARTSFDGGITMHSCDIFPEFAWDLRECHDCILRITPVFFFTGFRKHQRNVLPGIHWQLVAATRIVSC
jgi:hypothetical protein